MNLIGMHQKKRNIQDKQEEYTSEIVGVVCQDEYGYYLSVNGYFVSEKLDGSVKIFKNRDEAKNTMQNNCNKLDSNVSFTYIKRRIKNTGGINE